MHNEKVDKYNIVIDLCSSVENYNVPILLVSKKSLGVDKWQEMVNSTQRDYKERGLVISERHGDVISSKIYEGQAERDGRREPGSFAKPLFPHGLKKALYKDIVVVHTHPITPEIDHIKTTIFSDQDINNFINSTLNGLVMLDKGGAHLLVRRVAYNDHFDQELLRKSIVSESMKKDMLIMDVIKLTAQKLAQYGLYYFYTENRGQTETPFVRFNNACYL